MITFMKSARLRRGINLAVTVDTVGHVLLSLVSSCRADLSSGHDVGKRIVISHTSCLVDLD
jgi:hypothetical protein